MTDSETAETSLAARRRRGSSVILMVALIDLVVIVPYTFWLMPGDRLVRLIVLAVEGAGLLSLVCIALYLRRRGD